MLNLTNLPEPTEEYNNSQLNKRYLTLDWKEKVHPRWTYENSAYVDDEYLYQNEFWKLIIDNYPEEVDNKVIVRDSPEFWNLSDDKKKVIVTYKVYDIVNDINLNDERIKTARLLDQNEWTFDILNLTVSKAYDVEYYTDEELNHKKMQLLREKRNLILVRTDYALMISLEQNLILSQKMKNYRQSLRDLPANIDITQYSLQDISNEICFPEPPLDEEIYDSSH